MNKVILSIIVVAALVLAGIGGTLASYVDTELQEDDSLQTGSIDLQVKLEGKDYEDDPYLDEFSLIYLKPDEGQDVTKYVRNMGTLPGDFYLHFMDITSEEADDKYILASPSPYYHHPEPEYVAENGGQVGNVYVAGLGEQSDFSPYVAVRIRFDGQTVDLSAYDVNPADGTVTLAELACNQIYIGELEQCGVEHAVNYKFTFFNRTDGGYLVKDVVVYDPNWKFRHWPTNLYMGDIVKFDILYELWDGAPPQ
jgi:hypothetical protein